MKIGQLTPGMKDLEIRSLEVSAKKCRDDLNMNSLTVIQVGFYPLIWGSNPAITVDRKSYTNFYILWK